MAVEEKVVVDLELQEQHVQEPQTVEVVVELEVQLDLHQVVTVVQV
jgi:hypothetical protein